MSDDLSETSDGGGRGLFDQPEAPQIPEPDYSDPDSEPDVEGESYDEILEKLKSAWLLTEIRHRVSKSATDHFWRTALHFFHKLKSAPGNKRTNQFKSVRRAMYTDVVPIISLEIGYKNRTTGEIEVVNDISTPLKRYSPHQYEKLYEIGTVKVNIIKT